jgi:glucokinase
VTWGEPTSKQVLVNVEDGLVLISNSIPTLARQGPEAVMERMAKLISDLINESQIEKSEIGGLGISAPGMIDLETNTTLFLPNLYSEWRNIPVGERMESLPGFGRRHVK